MIVKFRQISYLWMSLAKKRAHGPMFFMALFNIVFISAPIKTSFKKTNNFKYDDPTSLSHFPI